MSQCQQCSNFLNPQDTFCGQCGTQVGAPRTTVLGGYGITPPPIAPTVLALQPKKKIKNLLSIFVVVVVILSIGVFSFTLGQSTKFGKSNSDNSHGNSGLNLPSKTIPTPQVTTTVTVVPIPTPSPIQKPTEIPISSPFHQGIHTGVIHHNNPVLEDGQLTLNLTLTGNTLNGFCTVTVQSSQPSMTCANGIVFGNISGSSIHFQVENMIFDGTIVKDGSMSGLYSYPPTKPQNDCGNGTWQTNPA